MGGGGLPCVAAVFTVQRILCRVRKWNVLLEFPLHKIEHSRNFENCFKISIVQERDFVKHRPFSDLVGRRCFEGKSDRMMAVSTRKILDSHTPIQNKERFIFFCPDRARLEPQSTILLLAQAQAPPVVHNHWNGSLGFFKCLVCSSVWNLMELRLGSPN